MADSDSEFPGETDEQKALRRRAARRATKKKNADARESFLASSSGFVDHDALRKSVALLKERKGLSPSDEAAGDDADVTAGAPGPRALAAPAPRAFPANNVNRWVPIGPSAVRRGEAEGRPRVSGRVRDLAVSTDGQRAYAATGKGGVWYTGDGGATWEPIGGWAREPRNIGGNTSAFSSGCLLVSFGAAAINEFVMVGTGEIGAFQGPANAAPMRGMGVLVASAPSIPTVETDIWEPATGIAGAPPLEGVSIVRMVRVPIPGVVAGQNGDQVIAATTGGLFLGTRTVAGGVGSFAWAPLASPAPPPVPAGVAAVLDPTDLIYVGSRLFVCFRSSGVAVSDNNGATFRWLTTLNAGLPAASVLMGRMSLAVNDDNNAVYVLGEVDTTPPPAANRTPVAQIWRIANPAIAAPATPVAAPLAGVPTSAQLWGTGNGSQRDYDQAIVVTTYTPVAVPPPPPPPVRNDRIYIGGSLTWLTNWNASIWAFDVAGAALVPAPGVSDQPAGTTHGASTLGLIGNAIHPDVHALRKATSADGTRQIWVGCDGGVFVSLSNGQVNTFASRNVGLASIEAGFVASHPTSSHFAMLGCQDNAVQVRVGESVWEVKSAMLGDGGGVIFHPVQSHYVMGQWIQGTWAADPISRYAAPIHAPPGGVAGGAENTGSAFYSGISAITIQPAGNQARIALGTNRVWVTDNLGTSNPNTWRVLPITPPPPPVPAPAPARDPRPGNRNNSTAANLRFGVPLPPAAIVNATPTGGLGSVITVKWVNSTTLLALYSLGIVRYVESGASTGLWTSTILLSPGMALPAAPFVIPAATFFTDIEPVPGSNDFYLTCTGQTRPWVPARPATPAVPAIPPNPAVPAVPAVAAQPPVAAADTCFYFDASAAAGAGAFLTTGLGQTLPVVPATGVSPIDPAYSVVVDPANVNNVYVGTVTGVWQSTKVPGNPPTHPGGWAIFDNGLPESTVQDLTIWTDPAGGATSPRLLRAALQSRGVWEVDLANQEPVRTYLRLHERDDRRMFPTPLKNPRRHRNAPDVSITRSPDITIRPEAPVANTPSFRGTNLVNGTLTYQLWTFQTAFRWLFPSVVPDGRWTDQFGDLIERHRRTTPGIPNPGSRRIDAALWNSVMAAAQDEAANPGVYRAPWQNALAPTSPGTEIDLMETVVPRRDLNNIWQVYRERSTVDVLLHHRDTRPVAANGAAAVLLWRTHRSGATLTATDCSAIPAYARSLFAGPALPTPAGWNVQLAADGTPLHRLGVPLAARMPRSVAINIDLSGIPSRNHVMLLALSGSTADQFSAVPTGPIDRVDRFVRNWPHAAARLISCWTRPGTQIH